MSKATLYFMFALTLVVIYPVSLVFNYCYPPAVRNAR